MMQYAGVRLLDTPYYIDSVFDYIIPPEFAEDVVPGGFVVVPFGIRNRLSTALVVEVRDHTKLESKEKTSVHKLKMIKFPYPDNLSLTQEQQELCSFLRTRTLCSTGEAVRALIPSAALSRLTEYYAPSDHIIDAPDELPSSVLCVYEHLRDNGETSMPRLRERFGIAAETAVRRLLAMEAVERRVVYREAVEGKTERLWSLAVSPGAAEALIAGEEWEGIRLSSAKHKRILSVLLEEGATMTTADLTDQAECTAAQLKNLLQKRLLLCEELQLHRNSYGNAPFVGMTPQELNEGQTRALETLTELIDSGRPRAALLHGVTGSGKTRVMTALIDRLIERGRGVILLLPEIALTPQSVAIFCARYGSRVAVIHSALSAGERYDAYCRIRRGEADVVIGTRSAVFAPVKSLGAIIIDEEQEHTYKSDQDPKYHARDIARFRCGWNNALMLPVSATPSLESYKKAADGSYTLIRLEERCGNARLPEVQIVDMRQEAKNGNSSDLSLPLLNALRENLARGEQSVLFLNRRGYHHAITCRSCGQPILCPNCSVAMAYHTRRPFFHEGGMVCHWCGGRQPKPAVCPSCGSEHLGFVGYGTQRMEEELLRLLPEARVLRMDADTTSTKFAFDRMLSQFRNGEADILLGTQMVTKGHDFPRVTLVGVLLADNSLYLDDYRASERTFSMLTQVIGRAGRGNAPGRAIIQTANPDHEIIRMARAQDYSAMYEREIRLRRLLCFPPSCDLAVVNISSRLEAELNVGACRLSEIVEQLQKEPAFAEVEVIKFGPFEAPVYRVDNRYRMRMIFKCRLTKPTLLFFHELLCRFGILCGRKMSVSVDFNPSNL